MTVSSIISVFGSSLPTEGMSEYAEARELGGILAKSGYIIATGGYRGVMEAASRGASEAGGHVIGVTCDRIEAFVPGLAAELVRNVDTAVEAARLVTEYL